MKIKKLLVFVLVGTLSLSNLLWAAAKTPGEAVDAEVKREAAASPSDAETEITNMDVLPNDSTASYLITWEKYKESVYCGQNYKVTVQNHGSSELYLGARVVSPDGKTVSRFCGSVAGNRENELEIPGRLFEGEGLYEISFVDNDDTSKIYSAPVSVKVEKLPSMTIRLTSNVFSGVHYQETLAKDRISYGQYDVIQTAGNVTLGEMILTNVTAVCVKETNSDTYVIKEMRADQCDRILVEENEYAHPIINKRTLESFSLKPETISIYEEECITLEPVIDNFSESQ